MMRWSGLRLFSSAPSGAIQAASSPTGKAQASTSVLPPTRTARACGLRRWPWQPAQRSHQWDGAGVEAERRVGDEQGRVEGVAGAEAVALGAHAVRAVEAEQLWAGRLVTEVAVRAGVVGGEEDVLGDGGLLSLLP